MRLPIGPGRVRAPEFPRGLPWLNTGGRPLTLAGLRGRVVLLDFWTYCCINCLHVLPVLGRLEERFRGEPFVVVGVHAAKFFNEREEANVRQAVLRYGVEHPVVVDSDLLIWRRYGVRAWPTLVLIDPEGWVVGVLEGEGHGERLAEAVGYLLHEFGRVGKLRRDPLPLAPEGVPEGGGTGSAPRPGDLAFPGKVLADEAGGRLFIADTNHHRVVVADLEGRVTDVVGSGRPGFADGGFGAASFRNPQGLALLDGALLVADTENHALRRVDLARRQVETVAGTGEQGWFPPRGPGRRTPLNSPWDVCVLGRTVYVAMAGCHQLWSWDPDSGEAGAVAGTGREARLDGSCAGAAFAQPSGLATDGSSLFVADSEVSCIRQVEPGGDGACRVRTLVGGDLFDFGDRDGTGDEVRLQHPLGVAWHRGVLYVADTYNHRIKRVDPAARRCGSWVGTGRPGAAEGERPELYEPGGLSAAAGTLYVADTNNHRVLAVDLETGRGRALPLT